MMNIRKLPELCRLTGLGLLGVTALLSCAHGQTLEDGKQILMCVQGYYDAYSKDSKVAASFYGEPVTIVSSNTIRVIPTQEGMEDYLVKSLANLKPLGYAYSGIGEYHIKYLNPTTALFSVMAMRYKADGTEQMRAGYTYLVRKDKGDWKIFANIATDNDKLLK